LGIALSVVKVFQGIFTPYPKMQIGELPRSSKLIQWSHKNKDFSVKIPKKNGEI
jgi:hypothetical protein